MALVSGPLSPLLEKENKIGLFIRANVLVMKTASHHVPWEFHSENTGLLSCTDFAYTSLHNVCLNCLSLDNMCYLLEW